MKNQILKHTGLTEKQFYAKYKTQKDFEKSKEGKSFKAQYGATMGPQQQPQGYVNPNGYQNYPSLMNNYQIKNIQFPKPDTNYDPNDIDPIPVNPNYGKKQQQASANYQDSSMYQAIGDYSTMDPGEKRKINPMEGIPIIGGLAKAFSMHKEQKKQLQKERQSYAVLGVQEQVSNLTPERIDNKWVTPWLNPTSSNTLHPAKGTGYTALSKNGNKVRGKKAFAGFNMGGGGASSTGFGGQMGFDGQQMMGGMSQTLEARSAGGAGGGAIGSVFGPGGQMVGALVGDALDKNPERILAQQNANQQRLENIITNYGYKNLHQGQFRANTRNGGNIDKARMGGNFKSPYQSPSEEGMIPYENGGRTAFNGDMQVDNGVLEPIAYNPHLPGTGITYKFNGPSHDDGGIPTQYGGTKIETEGLETVRESSNGSELSAQILGDMVVSAPNAKLLGDDKFAGMKFKNIDKKLSYQTTSINKNLNKTTEAINSLEVNDDFDKLRLQTLKLTLEGSNKKLADIAKTQTNLGNMQDAIHEVADIHGLKPAELAKGKLKPNTDKSMMSKYGASIEKAQEGKKVPKFSENYDENKVYENIAKTEGALDYTGIGKSQEPNFNTEENYKKYLEKVERIFKNPENVKMLVDRAKNFSGNDWKDVRAQINKGRTYEEQAAIVKKLATDSKPGPYHTLVDSFEEGETSITPITPVTPAAKATVADEKTPDTEAIPYKRSWVADVYNEVLPYLRRSDKEPLDINQLSGELYSMANNQLEPVQAQLYQPDLATPYGVSYQDIRNANQSDYISGQRMAGYNPAAQSVLNAQKYAANASTYGQEFRENQGRYDQTFDANRNLLNQAKLTNLNILDKQYERQAMAKSNTKEATQLAFNSISDKYAKKQLENRQLGILENTYNYRYDKEGRAVNLNPLFQPNIPTVGSKSGTQKQVPVYDSEGNIDHYQLEEIQTAKFGKSISKLSRNGSLVKAAKNL